MMKLNGGVPAAGKFPSDNFGQERDVTSPLAACHNQQLWSPVITSEDNVLASISIQGLSKTFPNGTKALDGINLEIGRSEMVALIGASGSGKSTLIRHIAGLVTADSSSVSDRQN